MGSAKKGEDRRVQKVQDRVYRTMLFKEKRYIKIYGRYYEHKDGAGREREGGEGRLSDS